MPMTLKNSHFHSQDLLRLLERQSIPTPNTKQLEDALKIGPGYGGAWYSSQREHWLRWLTEYPTPGPYGRKTSERTLAQVVYSRVNCPPMVFWLAETVGVHTEALRVAHQAAIKAPINQASQAGAIRSKLPWELVFTHIKTGGH